MTARTKGDLRGFTIRNENAFGTFYTSGTSVYGGTIQTLDPTGGKSFSEDVTDGSYKFATPVVTGMSAGYKVKFRYPISSDWQTWITRTIGGLTGIGTLRDITPFSSVIKVASDELISWLGCKVDSLTIASSKIGELLDITATIIAMYETESSTTTFTDAEGGSYIFAEAARPSYVPLSDNTPWQYSTDNGATWSSCDHKTWELQITRGLQSDASNVGGLPLDAGLSIIPTKCEVQFKFSQLSKSSEWDTLKRSGMTDLQFKKTIDNKVVLLTGGYLLPDNMPSRSQNTYDETIVVKIQDITVT
ncbi:MAG: hypothetical protein WCS17_11605 [Prevotella sp.]